MEAETKISIVAFLAIFLSGTTIAYADASVESRAASYLSNVLYATTHEALNARLRQSGLSENEIEGMVESATRSYAICVVDALRNNTIPDSSIVLEKLANGYSSEAIQEVFSGSTQAEIATMRAGLKAVLLPCVYTTNQELGIVD